MKNNLSASLWKSRLLTVIITEDSRLVLLLIGKFETYGADLNEAFLLFSDIFVMYSEYFLWLLYWAYVLGNKAQKG